MKCVFKRLRPSYKAENSSSMVQSLRKHSERNNDQDRREDTNFQKPLGDISSHEHDCVLMHT